ncbi:hypothetical protein DPMN_098831 [Dreissena polymorpha]|uniref:Uncharacterized protein n=1 Tax=Dreissena polymorpha TaxID=45954 RepID=A0A9D4R738_DREPO|nr:hypothetical protein DPMN_098831 [Dreissena polymorpha]
MVELLAKLQLLLEISVDLNVAPRDVLYGHHSAFVAADEAALGPGAAERAVTLDFLTKQRGSLRLVIVGKYELERMALGPFLLKPYRTLFFCISLIMRKPGCALSVVSTV